MEPVDTGLQVVKDSLTHRAGLLANDFLISIANKEVFDMSHDQVSELSYEVSKCKIEKGNSLTTVSFRPREQSRRLETGSPW